MKHGLHIIFPFSRHHLWRKLLAAYDPADIKLHILLWLEEPIPYPLPSWVDVCRAERPSFPVSLIYLLNYFINNHEINDEDFYVFATDDDLYSIEALERIKSFDDEVVFISMKRGDNAVASSPYPADVLIAKPENVRCGGIGGEQVFMKGSVVKNVRYDQSHPYPDGDLAMNLKNTRDIRYEPDIFALFNYFEPGRWNEVTA